jgi:hypothetical protein
MEVAPLPLCLPFEQAGPPWRQCKLWRHEMYPGLLEPLGWGGCVGLLLEPPAP